MYSLHGVGDRSGESATLALTEAQSPRYRTPLPSDERSHYRSPPPQRNCNSSSSMHENQGMPRRAIGLAQPMAVVAATNRSRLGTPNTAQHDSGVATGSSDVESMCAWVCMWHLVIRVDVVACTVSLIVSTSVYCRRWHIVTFLSQSVVGQFIGFVATGQCSSTTPTHTACRVHWTAR
jgi:hypothetical protein